MVLCIVLYPTQWYYNLNAESVRLSQDHMVCAYTLMSLLDQTLIEHLASQDTVRLPAVALMSLYGNQKSPNFLTSPPPKCFLSDYAAGFQDNVTGCKQLTHVSR